MKLTSRILSILLFVMTLLAAGGVQAVNLKGVGGAGLILTNGQICTESGTAEAIAIGKEGVIYAVGDADMVAGYKVSDTKVIDLAGDAVLPGLHDIHVHPRSGYKQGCVFPQGSTLKVVQETLAECVKGSEKGELIRGGQWDAASLGGLPHRRMLDKVSPDNPVVLSDISGHSSWANSLALEKSGITKDTPDPQGGIVERDEDGRPTGVLRERAARLLRLPMKPPKPGETQKALEWALNEMLSYGITSLTDAGVGSDLAKIYVTMADTGKLKQRVRLCLMWSPDSEQADAMIAERNLYVRDLVCPDCVKMVLDGVPTDSHTAAMVEDYADTVEGRDDEVSRKGLLMLSSEVVNEAVTRFDAMGMTVKFHTAGDAGVRQALDAIAVARSRNGFSGQHHNPGHCGFVQMSDIRRARNIAATFEVSPYIWYPHPIIPDHAKALGPERMKRAWPVRDMLDAGALVVPGSDWAVVDSVNPWIAIETLVTRQKPGGSVETMAEGQKITLKQAIDLFTVNSAKQMGNGDKTGRIETGMLADLIVVDRNPYKIPITEVHGTIVKKAIVNGKVVYER